MPHLVECNSFAGQTITIGRGCGIITPEKA
jgi:hypothetical protein